jgi:hypothetical protein
MLRNADSFQKKSCRPALMLCRGRTERRSKAKESQQKPRSRLGFPARHLGFSWLSGRRKAKESQPKPRVANVAGAGRADDGGCRARSALLGAMFTFVDEC